jgi:uroporphyrinogen-III decarboxylase
VQRDYPISEAENLMRALRHEKPLWMPNFEGSVQDIGFGTPTPPLKDGDVFTNMFGVVYQFSEVQGSATPITKAFEDITESDKLEWPDLSKMDFKEDAEKLERDEERLLAGHLGSACFEQLHMLEGFEQTLVDLITEPEKIREFFEKMVDFQLQYFHKMNDAYNFDLILYHDDWGTARAPFFSVDLFKETILPPTIRLVKEIRETGVLMFFHNCGLIDDFIPFLVEDIHADGMQIQIINDIGGIIKKYGERVTVEYRRPDPYLLFDPDTTSDQIKELARWVVDSFGAHNNPGSGAVTTVNAPTAEVFNTFDEELYKYSLEKYGKI